ncbi:MAG: FAD-dependent oxidoreductase [Actinomycetota bacterium]
MPTIDSYRFGHIVIDGQEHTRDVIILPGRVEAGWWRKDGHSLVMEDLDDVVDALPERLVVGTGADARMEPDPDAIRALEAKGIRVEVLPTGEAVRRFGELDPANTAAALHLTCSQDPVPRAARDSPTTLYDSRVLRFDAETRRRSLERMADDELDLLVIGGGITGCGIALDASSRGLRVGLVERDDFASGTSGRSSRLIHGGVRYLERYEFDLVHEALRERATLLRLAPHLVRPVPMIAPLPHALTRMQWRAGLALYDTLALWRNIGRHRGVSPNEVRQAVPGLVRPAPGLRYFECRTDDARLTLEVVRAAAAHGASVANHAEVVGIVGDGRVSGAVVADRVAGESLKVRAKVTVNATGVWADGVQSMATDAPQRLRPSKGIHLVFRPGAVDTTVGVVIPTAAADGRFVFVIPWGGRTYAGTTDTPHDGSLDDPEVTANDRAYVLDAVMRAFPVVHADDVVASWAGLRPLLGGRTGRTADLSRKHAIYESPPGLLTITGGKLTTYRAMAEQLVDRAAGSLGSRRRSRTRRIPLGLTAPIGQAMELAAARTTGLGLPAEVGHRLVYRFGDDWTEAAARIESSPALGEPVREGLPVVRVELEMARDREMAVTDDDVLVRRTRLTTLDARARSTAGGSAV